MEHLVGDKTRRVLLVGWDAADWKVARPLIEAGEMPNLARLVAEGASGNLATLQPALSPMLWTSIATGKRPRKHGIHGFSEPLPNGKGVRPITTLGRKCKAVWNILHQVGLRPSVVGWWPSIPAEPIRGVMVSNLYHHAGDGPEAREMSAGTVHPASWAERLAELRVTPMELPGEVLGALVPGYGQVDQTSDKRVHVLARILAETMSVHAAATEVLEFAEWDFAAVYYDAIDHFSHAFMGYHPPRQGKVSKEDFEIYGPTVANAYRYHDAMLGRLMELAGDDATVIVMSDHGFHSDALRPAHIPAEAAGPAVEHRDFGMLAMRGPGIKAGETIVGAGLLDITPTLLHLFGLPVGADMDGKVLVTALVGLGEVAMIPSWEAVAGEAGTHPAETQLDSVAAAEAMRQLVDLGYVAPPGKDEAEHVAETVAELKYNLARSMDDAGEGLRSVLLHEELIERDPLDQRYAERVVGVLIQLGRVGEARRRLDAFDAATEANVPVAQAELERRRAVRGDETLGKNDALETMERRRLAERATGFVTLRAVLRLRLEMTEGRLDAARATLAALEGEGEEEGGRTAGRGAVSALRFAESYALLGDDARALAWVERALERNEDDWQAMALGARLHLRGRRVEKALELATASLALMYHQPVLHFVLGRALLLRGDFAGAESAYLVSIRQLPGLVPAHEALARLYERRLNRPAEALVYRDRAVALRERQRQEKMVGGGIREDAADRLTSDPAMVGREAPSILRRDSVARGDAADEIVVVAGLPRSGTSMLMQFLSAGGIPALTDGQRTADSDNPRGYFEYEPATHLGTDASWVPGARGKVVKLALPLVKHLPGGERYRVLVIEREVADVLASQGEMLKRLGKGGAAMSGGALAAEYARQREVLRQWLAWRQEVAVLPVRYEAILADPAGFAREVAGFLERPFDVEAAAAAVDPKLRRQRAGEGRSAAR